MKTQSGVAQCHCLQILNKGSITVLPVSNKRASRTFCGEYKVEGSLWEKGDGEYVYRHAG